MIKNLLIIFLQGTDLYTFHAYSYFYFAWNLVYFNMQLLWNLVINYSDPCCITYIKSWKSEFWFLTLLLLTATDFFFLKLKLLCLLYLLLTLILDYFKIDILGRIVHS
jgi:hypothetical protein